MSLQNFIETAQSELQSPDVQQALATASRLWRKYGQGTRFNMWLENEVRKAKQSGVWKQTMSFQEIFNANRGLPPDFDAMKNDAPGAPIDPNYKAGDEPVSDKKFTIGGMNGYVVLIGGGAILVTLIWLGSKYLIKK